MRVKIATAGCKFIVKSSAGSIEWRAPASFLFNPCKRPRKWLGCVSKEEAKRARRAIKATSYFCLYCSSCSFCFPLIASQSPLECHLHGPNFFRQRLLRVGFLDTPLQLELGLWSQREALIEVALRF